MASFANPLAGAPGLQIENPNTSDDAFGQYLKSLMGTSGAAGTNILNLGQGLVGKGQSLTDPAAAYWQAILSGDPNALTKATAPTASMMSTLYSGALTNANQGLPQGGYRSSMVAQLPFAQASQVGNFLLGLQPQAAQQLGTLGLDTSQLGLSESGLGSNLLQLALQSELARRGQNMTADSARLSTMVQGITGAMDAAAKAYSGGGGQPSDIRVKEGIIPLGEMKGVPIYAFRYIGETEVRLGVMAQEVRDIVPSAVIERNDGVLMVDYGRLFEHLGVN